MNEELKKENVEELTQTLVKAKIRFDKLYAETNSGPQEEESTLEIPTEVAPIKMQDSSSFPDVPVNPTMLATKVTEKLNSFPNFVVPDKTPSMVEELCKSFNECIRLNEAGESQTLILSPKTGSAKSVSSQMYVSQLEKHATIVVVFTIEDAIEACKNINEWSGDNNYARCTYTITTEIENSPFRVDRYKLKNYRCVVISHALFKLLNDKKDIELLSEYMGKQREFVLIDERIDLYKEVTFPLENLQYLSKLFNDIKAKHPLPLVDNAIQYFTSLEKKFDLIGNMKETSVSVVDNKLVSNIDSKDYIFFHEELKKSEEIETYSFDEIFNQIDNRVLNLKKIMDPLNLIGKNFDIGKVNNEFKARLHDLSTILAHNFNYFAQPRNGQSATIMITRNILNRFGSSVVLDATATVNALYNDKVIKNEGTVKLISTTNPRKYDNCTIYKCRGVPQGKSSIYTTLAPKELETIVDLYVTIADSLLIDKSDKLLIVAHKDFKELLEKKIGKKSIEFTHWGNHRGKNKWSHCNKVLVIGWNYIPTEVHYRNYINAVNGAYNLSNDDLKAIKNNYEMTQIADDLVQAVNRGAVRTTISSDGNCAKSGIYMFYPTGLFGEELMAGFEDEFEGATISEWKPVGIEKIQKLAKSYANIERVANYIQRKVEKLGEIKQSQVQKYFDDQVHPERSKDAEERMPKSTVSNAMKHTEFELLLQTMGIHRVPINGTSFKFTNNALEIY